jgi:hypothetical protein
VGPFARGSQLFECKFQAAAPRDFFREANDVATKRKRHLLFHLRIEHLFGAMSVARRFFLPCSQVIHRNVLAWSAWTLFMLSCAAFAQGSTMGLLEAALPASSTESNAAHFAIGLDGRGRGDTIIGPGRVLVLAIIGPSKWMGILSRAELRQSYRNQSAVHFGKITTYDPPSESFQSFVGHLREGPWLAHVLVVASRKAYWIGADSLWVPCLGGGLNGGPHAAISACKKR